MGHFNRDRGGRGNDRRGGGGFNRDRGGQRSMHKAVCDACHKDCEVPFRPTGDKPIFCSDCFSKQGHGGDRQNKFGGGRDSRPRFENKGGGSDNSKEILKAIKTLNYKIDQLTKALVPEFPGETIVEETKEAPAEKPASPKTASRGGKAVKKKVTKKKVTTKKKAAKKPANLPAGKAGKKAAKKPASPKTASRGGKVTKKK